MNKLYNPILIQTDMKMSYELITPEIAEILLSTNPNNRCIAKGRVESYAADMSNSRWCEKSGDTITIDRNGILRNGHHRCKGIIKSGKSIKTWVCRNVEPDSIYDYVRARSTRDQVKMSHPEWDDRFKDSTIQSALKYFCRGNSRAPVSPQELISFIELYGETIIPLISSLNMKHNKKTSYALVWITMIQAYMSGVPVEDVKHFFEVLNSGFPESSRDNPILAYRKYLIEKPGRVDATDEEIKRAQYAINSYLDGSATKRTRVPKAPIYNMLPFSFDYREV